MQIDAAEPDTLAQIATKRVEETVTSNIQARTPEISFPLKPHLNGIHQNQIIPSAERCAEKKTR